MNKLAIILFNLGGPDRPEAVEPFLFNLFNDPAIIGIPQPFRWLLARFISRKRAPVARGIYDHLGGASPLLELTRAQAEALGSRLQSEAETRVFIAMRYWYPRSQETALAVKDFGPDQIVLLPLYPQYSTTTSESSLDDWRRAAEAVGLTAPTATICCYPTEAGFIRAHAKLIAEGLAEASAAGKPRVLFSAHGLPKRIVEKGDPYAWQVEQTAASVVAAIGRDDLDWAVCYQSRVGPEKWIDPSTEDELARAGRDGVPVVVVPIAFVSEHSETLVELDIEYRQAAAECGIPRYVRIPALGTDPDFIDGLAGLVQAASHRREGLGSQVRGRVCPARCGRCPNPNAETALP